MNFDVRVQETPFRSSERGLAVIRSSELGRAVARQPRRQGVSFRGTSAERVFFIVEEIYR